ncbi:MAG: orotate phosphoribosyltransferase [Anaerolineae bacterium]|nr:orotate phosphoribosyltransferase [Anaerolineae bacterium]
MESPETKIARTLLEIGAVVFTPYEPITFKSGIKSPVYVDNRRLPFRPAQWQTVIEGFTHVIEREALEFDVIAGIATAGIPHSAALGYVLQKPSVFVRKEAKAHGTRSQIEGGDVSGKRVLLVEDLATTGGSSLAGVEALRDAGARVSDCLCIVTYGFPEAAAAFERAHVRLHALAPFRALVYEAAMMGYFDVEAIEVIEAWARDPHHWEWERTPA